MPKAKPVTAGDQHIYMTADTRTRLDTLAARLKLSKSATVARALLELEIAYRPPANA